MTLEGCYKNRSVPPASRSTLSVTVVGHAIRVVGQGKLAAVIQIRGPILETLSTHHLFPRPPLVHISISNTKPSRVRWIYLEGLDMRVLLPEHLFSDRSIPHRWLPHRWLLKHLLPRPPPVHIRTEVRIMRLLSWLTSRTRACSIQSGARALVAE